LEEGDSLPLVRETVDERAAKELLRPYSLGLPERVRVVLGPQDDHFSEAGLNTFLEEFFVVTRQADRMGLRLSGPRLEHASGFNIVSDGIATGAIQVPGDGQPILLLADHQTTGGYPKIATVVSADLPALGRAVPGVQVRFQPISVEEAQAAKQKHSRNLNDAIQSMRQVNLNPKDIASTTLLSKNLISGVVNSHSPI
jgi:allophanate hydrolase